MSRVLLDTDILSEITKRKDPIVVSRAERYLSEHGRLTLSAISVLEIVRGFWQVRRPDRVAVFEASLVDAEVLPFDDAAARLAGRIYADLEVRGRIIGMPDAMIAAIAISHDLPVVTGNVAHFEWVREAQYPLTVENWRTA
jgi:tRNA(fMet)-specific endonuclease VapC